ncbi:MAG: outer membrane lipoprotein carrier protein LolA [Oceanospirillaceae bacterium]|uniref:outer membrane lipoprotein chaperone LolA n=1 Tax=Thalassolituus sp. UBA1505 TaxID=1947653 RepID=UPI000C683FAB|nr:outer membrane lipoprotein chaperone LolA [Thalassolituus sp. UBA1505]MAS25517.1 outer membrane lipoprotein carrier protein LolA [Oceanospirillaceae bacterium]MBL34608.1 outer membrane lipoprotein carrier protein LolA [Oceanospirillaceae bacterium]MBS54928.1 outer membrane lipoprotein carrier protein LolA [Oceanospirillaceae bacterium]|tara:strand:+ start:111 stop:761 length:651 start_codon:yes stop_codon:yes gene_type:complete
MTKHLISAVLMLISLTMASIAPAYADNDAALNDFLARIKNLQTLDSRFEQSTRDNHGQVLQSMTGQLTVAKPGKLRWHTDEPFEQLVVSDGELVWVYDMDLEQVTIRNMDQRIQETPALLLTGDAGNVEKSFLVEEEKAGDEIVFQLVPKDNSQLFESLEFHYRDQQIVRMMIFDAAGQITEISFDGVAINQPVDDQAFVFNVPEGVDVIDGRHGR